MSQRLNHRSHRLAELTRVAVADRVAVATALVPIGACEQHGPHLALGTDAFVVEHVAHEAATALGGDPDVIVTPALPFGYSAYHLAQGATVTLRTETVLAVLRDVLESLARSGFRRAFVLNGHGGNAELITVAARSAGVELGLLAGAGSYWTMAWDELVAAGAQDRGRLPGHAGAFETSLLAALRPDLLSGTELPRTDGAFTPNPRGYARPYTVEDPSAWTGSGFSDNPAAADAADGERWLAVIASAVGAGLRQFASVPVSDPR